MLITNVALLYRFFPLTCQLKRHIGQLDTATVPLKTVAVPLTEERIPPWCRLVSVGLTGKVPERTHNSGKE